jgi:hypothetical protein
VSQHPELGITVSPAPKVSQAPITTETYRQAHREAAVEYYSQQLAKDPKESEINRQIAARNVQNIRLERERRVIGAAVEEARARAKPGEHYGYTIKDNNVYGIVESTVEVPGPDLQNPYTQLARQNPICRQMVEYQPGPVRRQVVEAGPVSYANAQGYPVGSEYVSGMFRPARQMGTASPQGETIENMPDPGMITIAGRMYSDINVAQAWPSKKLGVSKFLAGSEQFFKAGFEAPRHKGVLAAVDVIGGATGYGFSRAAKYFSESPLEAYALGKVLGIGIKAGTYGVVKLTGFVGAKSWAYDPLYHAIARGVVSSATIGGVITADVLTAPAGQRKLIAISDIAVFGTIAAFAIGRPKKTVIESWDRPMTLQTAQKEGIIPRPAKGVEVSYSTSLVDIGYTRMQKGGNIFGTVVETYTVRQHPVPNLAEYVTKDVVLLKSSAPSSGMIFSKTYISSRFFGFETPASSEISGWGTARKMRFKEAGLFGLEYQAKPALPLPIKFNYRVTEREKPQIIFSVQGGGKLGTRPAFAITTEEYGITSRGAGKRISGLGQFSIKSYGKTVVEAGTISKVRPVRSENFLLTKESITLGESAATKYTPGTAKTSYRPTRFTLEQIPLGRTNIKSEVVGSVRLTKPGLGMYISKTQQYTGEVWPRIQQKIRISVEGGHYMVYKQEGVFGLAVKERINQAIFSFWASRKGGAAIFSPENVLTKSVVLPSTKIMPMAGAGLNTAVGYTATKQRLFNIPAFYFAGKESQKPFIEERPAVREKLSLEPITREKSIIREVQINKLSERSLPMEEYSYKMRQRQKYRVPFQEYMLEIPVTQPRGKIFPGPVIPIIKEPPPPPPPPGNSFELGDFFKGGFGSFKNVRQKRGYQPDLFSAMFGFRGMPSKGGIMSGLGIRGMI